MNVTISVAPPYSVVLVLDSNGAEIPEKLGGRPVASTPTCLAIGTYAAVDGATEISFGGSGRVADIDGMLVFDGVLNSSSKKLVLCSVLEEVYAETALASTMERVRVWSNHPSEPDKIWIVVGE